MDTVSIDKLIKRYGLVSDQVDASELRVILRELVKVLERGEEGAIVEFGCYRGTTSLYIRRILNALSPERPFHVYDSFEGLPDKTSYDSSPAGMQFKQGELAVSKANFVMEFKKAGLKLPVIHKGWFNQLADADIPSPTSFAFLDGDYYESVRDSLRLIEGKLSPGATIIVDDYANEALPGAAKAVDEWVRTRKIRVTTNSSLAVITIP